MYTALTSPKTTAGAKDFMTMVRDKVNGKNSDNIIYIDQTLIIFSEQSKKSMDVK